MQTHPGNRGAFGAFPHKDQTTPQGMGVATVAIEGVIMKINRTQIGAAITTASTGN
ncbi:MAG: hypothetical protein M3R67_13660 [Acidobacteriota bacterium]|nr:hypothetical protein [Acidobacteriota bacterium]